MSTPVVIPFRVQRVTLAAGIQYEVIPPITCATVAISNVSGGDIFVQTTIDGTEYFSIPTDLQHSITLWQPFFGQFRKGAINFWLLSAGGGDIVLRWS